jgi:hypothetical protein
LVLCVLQSGGKRFIPSHFRFDTVAAFLYACAAFTARKTASSAGSLRHSHFMLYGRPSPCVSSSPSYGRTISCLTDGAVPLLKRHGIESNAKAMVALVASVAQHQVRLVTAGE